MCVKYNKKISDSLHRKRNETLTKASKVFTKFNLFHQCHRVVENRIQDSGNLKGKEKNTFHINALTNYMKKKRLRISLLTVKTPPIMAHTLVMK